MSSVDGPADGVLPDPEDYAKGAEALHEQIIGSFCHDLRQPLNAALMRLASLKRAYTSGQDRELLEELHLNLREISNMSETVFDAIRLSRSSIKPNLGAVSIAALFERLRHEFTPLAEQKGLKLTVSPSPYVVVTDEILLGRILWNLVHNALNYTHEGGILVAARRVSGQFSLEVWDTGKGIREDEIEKVFTPFYRGASEREQSPGKNTGIGLWNGREFARLLGGDLSVQSRHGRGSVFRLRLPVPVETLKPRPSQSVAAARPSRLLVALLSSDSDVLIDQQRLVLARGDAHVSFSDPLQMLAYLNVPLNRPDALVIDMCTGPVSADFLVGILAVRYPELPVAVVADPRDGALATSLGRFEVRLLERPLAASGLDEFLGRNDVPTTLAVADPGRDSAPAHIEASDLALHSKKPAAFLADPSIHPVV